MTKTPTAPPSSDGGAPIDSMGGCLLMVFARFGGALALATIALLIALRAPWRFSVLDIVYAVALGAWLAAQRAQAGRDAAAGTDETRSKERALPLATFAAIAAWIGAQSIRLG